jgi:hypothetical protein
MAIRPSIRIRRLEPVDEVAVRPVTLGTIEASAERQR